MSSEFPPPNIAPQDDGSVANADTPREASSPAPITEQEVGEYREQDRFLPVSTHLAVTPPLALMLKKRSCPHNLQRLIIPGFPRSPMFHVS